MVGLCRFLIAGLSIPVSLAALLSTGSTLGPAGYVTTRVGPPNAVCTRQAYSLNNTSTNYMFENVSLNANETYITQILQDYVTTFPYLDNFTDTYQCGMQNISATYSMSGTLCLPVEGEKNPQDVQLLIHGIGYDASYWDFAPSGVNDNSFVYSSAAAGIATFRYDLLGTGHSEHPFDGYNAVQKPADIAIAIQFAQMLRAGEIGGCTYSRIVAVGHGYGSIQIQAMTAIAPTAVDGIVLTAYSGNMTAFPMWLASTVYTPASLVFPMRFPNADMTNSYLVALSPWTTQFSYWYSPYYGQAMLDYARSIEQPVSQGVLFTIANNITAAPQFTGDVLILTGDKDFMFCYRNCYAVPAGANYTSIPAGAQALFPAARTFETYIPPNTGHMINLHYSAPDSFQYMIQFAETVFAS